MKNKLRALGMIAVLAGGAMLLPSAKADDFNKQTVVTLNTAVEVSGTVLQPGQYVFKLADSDVERNVVQIFNADDTHLITSVMGVPAQRSEAGDVKITLNEEPAGAPETLRNWFFAGEESGIHFVNPGDQQ